MKHSLHRLMALVALVLATGGAAVLGTSQSGHPPVYSVAEVQSHLARSPAAWVGRTVRIRGVAVPPGCILRGSMLCVAESSYLAYLVDPTRTAFLPLTRGAANSLLAFLRRLPLAANLAPPAQTPPWGAIATYRAELLDAPPATCALAPCYQALLLDAAPDASWGASP